MATPDLWYYQTNGKTIGPCSAADLKRVCQSGGLKPTDCVRPESREQWSPASKVRGLFPDPAASTIATVATSTATSPPPLPPSATDAATAEKAFSAGKKLFGAARMMGSKAIAGVAEPNRPAVVATPAETELVVAVLVDAAPVDATPIAAPAEVIVPMADLAVQEPETPTEVSDEMMLSGESENADASLEIIELVTEASSDLQVPVVVSASAEKLRSHLSQNVWQELLDVGLPSDQDFFWIRLDSLRSNQSPESKPGGGGFFQNASQRLSKLAESASIKTNRYLIYANDGHIFVTTQLAAAGHAWKLDRSRYTMSNRWSGSALEVVLESSDDGIEVQSVSCRFELSTPFTVPYSGSPSGFVSSAQVGRVSLTGADCLPFPLNVRKSNPRQDAFTHSIESKGTLSWISISREGFLFTHGDLQETLPFSAIVAWQSSDEGVAILESTEAGIRRYVIATNAAVSFPDAAEMIAANAQAAVETKPDTELENVEKTGGDDSSIEKEVAATDAEDPLDLTSDETESDEPECLILQTFSRVVSALGNHCNDRRCETLTLAAEFNATALFNAPQGRVLTVLRDETLSVYVGDADYDQMQLQATATPASLAGSRFLGLQPAGHYCIDIPTDEAVVWNALQLTFGADVDPASEAGTVVLVSADQDSTMVDAPSATDDASVSETSEPWRMRLSADGLLILTPAAGTDADEIALSTEAVGRKATMWTAEYGTVSVRFAEDQSQRTLTAPPQTLIAIWEAKELRALKKRTQGVSLGEIYDEFNRCRRSQFLAGVYGNYFLTHQRLELASPLNDFIAKVESMPPGALPDELEQELIQRLSILEVARQQLGRWLDRCSLMYPHCQANQTRRFLQEAFGDQLADAATREREAWKVHQQTRGELRQIQAAMNRAVAEVGQNLSVISFAFPEEVRCAALAATRRAASMAGKGAMIAAFAGVGGQLMMGMARASVGDPMGVAMLGTIGLSLIGKNLEKNAQDTEKRIRIRAYGLQSLQWWNVVLETAAVMAVETQHNLELAQEAAMARDRKLLEKLPREQLPAVQKKMVATMRTMMKEDVSGQFYEAIPGSGVFGWHMVDQIAELTQSSPTLAMSNFESEVPGSIGKGLRK